VLIQERDECIKRINDIANDDRAIRTIMFELEQPAEVDRIQAVKLMIDLWPVADRLCIHDICDGIDLWLIEKPEYEICDYIFCVLHGERDKDLRVHWGVVLNGMEQGIKDTRPN
jgi:hypothetical protein